MKSYSPIVWGLAAIVIGLMIMIYPINAIEIMLQVIGVILLAVGAIQLITFFAVRKNAGFSWTAIPLGGVLAVVLGIMLLVSPQIFLSFFMILVGIVLIVLGVLQIVNLTSARKLKPTLPVSLYAFPVLMMLSGVIFFIFPIATTAWIVIFAGAWILAYGISEIVGYFLLKSK